MSFRTRLSLVVAVAALAGGRQAAAQRKSAAPAALTPAAIARGDTDSPNRHATKHANATQHPVIASGEPGERWLYCDPDDVFAEY